MNDERNSKVFRLRGEDSFPALINVITIRDDGRMYDDMYFHDGAHHGGGYNVKFDDSTWSHNMADYDLGFHEPYEGDKPDPEMLAQIQSLPVITGEDIWVRIKDGFSVLDVNEKARRLNATTH